MDPVELANHAERIARLSAQLIRTARRDGVSIAATKSSVTDMVTETDRAVEALIVHELLMVDPDASILGEESGAHVGSNSLSWIVDPIDGTTNFVYGLSGYNVSIAAAIDGEIVAGVVYDPVRDELFRAVAGGGATCNGQPIGVRSCPSVSQALIGTGFSYDAERRRAQGAVLGEVIGDVRDVRRLGAAALDLCMVACGRLDGYYESGMQPWDIAAGALIASEAGAIVAGLHRTAPSERLTIVASPDIFEAFHELLRACEEKGLEVVGPSA